jgi:signal transduction histidine kinase
MGNPRTASGNLTQEQAIIFRGIERLRIAQDFHDRVAPELLVAVFQLNQIQMDLESRNLPESAELQKVADRIGSAIHEFLAVLDPANEEVQQADSNLN